MIFFITIFAVILVISGVIVTRNVGYAVKEGKASINVAGRIKLTMLRASIPLFAGVKKAAGIEKKVIKSVTTIAVPTSYGEMPVTVYKPVSDQTSLPAYFNFHGGGFVLGHAEQDDLICRYIAAEAGCIVLNMDYVLAPEHPFPAAIVQSYEAIFQILTDGLVEGIDNNKLAIGGQSAGAAIATSLLQLTKDKERFQFCLQVLNYGYFDLKESSSVKQSGNRRQGDALSIGQLEFFRRLYLKDISLAEAPMASPAYSSELNGLPPALIIAAGHDLLFNDSRCYAERLEAEGVTVEYIEFPDADHGFTYFGPPTSSKAAYEVLIRSLKASYMNIKQSGL